LQQTEAEAQGEMTMRPTIPMLVTAVLMALPAAAMAQTAGATITRDQVDPRDPFGEIDVSLTMLDPRTIEAWAGGLDEERQAELRGRCQVMVENEARYDIAGRAFCRTLLGQ
jgi:hypothetical protein